MIRFEDRVARINAGSCTMYALPTSVTDIVTFRGSFRSCPDMLVNEDLAQSLCVSTLDRGTSRRSKLEIAESLERLGAEIHFSSDDLRVGFHGRCLKPHVRSVIELLAEQLRDPALDATEIDIVRVQAIAAARQSMDRTADQAESLLRRALFHPAHPNYGISPEESIQLYESIDADTIRRYHARHFGARDLNIVFVGDLETETISDVVADALGDWPDHGAGDSFSTEGSAGSVKSSFVEMPDKPNSDVHLGHRLDLRRDHPDFVPLYVANYILGGNFSARLMARIRDELGLTYGIHSALYDVSTEYDGYWGTSVTLSTENVDVGTEQTLAELSRFVDEGVTEAELATKKTTITGSFAVGLATTGGLARSLLINIERGFGPGYLDRFPEEVENVTLEQANAAITAYLDASRLHVATAGSERPEGATPPAAQTSG